MKETHKIHKWKKNEKDNVMERAKEHANKVVEKTKKNSKVHTVMSEFKHGTLHSGSGGKVHNRKQAIAIALSEARKHGAKIPEKK